MVYKELEDLGIEVLFDDRLVSAGEKFGDSDLIGLPVRLVVSNKNGEKVEFKKRQEDQTEVLSIDEVIKKLK